MTEEEIQAAADAVNAAQPAADPNIVDQLIESGVDFLISALAALVILIIGLWIAKKVKRVFANALTKKGVDATLIGFFSSMLYAAIAVFVVIAAIGKLGVQTTSFAAVIAAAGWQSVLHCKVRFQTSLRVYCLSSSSLLLLVTLSKQAAKLAPLLRSAS